MELLMRRLSPSSITKRSGSCLGPLSCATTSRPSTFRPNPLIRRIPQRKSSNTTPRGKEPTSNAARRYYRAGTAAALVTAGLVAWNLIYPRQGYAEAAVIENAPDDNGAVRKIRLAEVHEHGQDADQYWVVWGTRVYDITDWVPNHPGGDVILRGVGGSVEPYWNIFKIHQKQDVYDILEQYFIGEVDPRDLVDGEVPLDAIEDPFTHDPARDERLRQLTDRPCNAETPGDCLCGYITPNELFYVRNHMWVPVESEDEHKLTIELHDGTEVEYTMAALRSKFKEHHVTAVLQCSGNRRAHMTREAQHTNGLQWEVGAIGNAVWTGVRLRDVLKDAGLDVNEPPDDVKHAQFMGSEAYGASIPIDKAVDARGDVLLAYGMNGQTLPRDHGFPLRVIVPGNVAARSVKWVNRVTLSDEESTSQWQRRDYKCFGPNIGSSPDWDSAVSIQEMPVQSAVTRLISHDGKDGRCCPCAVLEGYAVSGGGRRIVRVDISADDGRTWQQADLLDPAACSQGPSEEKSSRQLSAAQRSDGTEGPSGDAQKGLTATPPDGPADLVGVAKGCRAWSWQRWRIQIPKESIGAAFLVKAVDEAYNTQPQGHKSNWNARGNLATGWHRICNGDDGQGAEQKEPAKA